MEKKLFNLKKDSSNGRWKSNVEKDVKEKHSKSILSNGMLLILLATFTGIMLCLVLLAKMPQEPVSEYENPGIETKFVCIDGKKFVATRTNENSWNIVQMFDTDSHGGMHIIPCKEKK